ncbi:MAG: Spy/CpxP family protein refolding chaperone [Balneolaceae bacterium]|nr:Spy/CpxP family protein refolding chaperone [Balneolaceae bacterium]MBO6547590.1 Spy/CpxP family protein refolding chaperone [Balneolaceae bacterium]MBO6648101.1 Spy/CpxP family protein refolding chaperone [Balneolaceae bacterium]
MKYLSLLFSLCILSSFNIYAQHQNHTSEYAGQEHREIKSLSEEDITQLKAGKGWGLAKAAELNGVPGPSHILEMASEIDLSDTQYEQIQSIFDEMQQQAISLGEKFISKEKELNSAFKEGEINPERLRELTSEIGLIRGELTFTHLQAHLKSAEVLSDEQIKMYNTLRGYDLTSDPCSEVPEGHDPEMWKQHNNCSR